MERCRAGSSQSAEFQVSTKVDATLALDYVGLLGRAADADAGGLAYWQSQVQGGTDAASVVRAFLGSDEYHERFRPQDGHVALVGIGTAASDGGIHG